MPHIRNVGGVSPLPFFIRASSFKCSNHWKRHGQLKMFLNGTMRLGLSLVSSLLSTVATTVAKVSLFSTWTRSTVSFYSM